ncbi:hypothetical protein QEN19_000484 [Hanseniaspora menglaensis]
MAAVSRKYSRLFIQLAVLVFLAVIIFTLIRHNDTTDMILETSIKPHSAPKNFGLVSDLHLITCMILPLAGEICLNKYAKEDMVNKDLLQNKHKYKNSFKKWFQFGFTKYLIIKRVNDIDDMILEGISFTVPEGKEYKKLFLVNQPCFLTFKENLGNAAAENGFSNIDLLFGEKAVEARMNYKILDSVAFKGDDKKFEISVSAQTKQNSVVIDNQVNTKDIFTVDKKNLSKFKILQLADLHYSIGPGVCRDPFPPEDFAEGCEADVITYTFVDKLLDLEAPDFVVFSGDQIMGDLCTQDSETCLLKVVKPLIDRKISYTFIWGNHDDEGSLSRSDLSKFASTLPYSYYFHDYLKNDKSFGYGNNIINFVSSEEKDKVLMKLFFLDSHKYSLKPKIYPGYDWIKEEQWQYLTELSGESSESLNAAFYHIPLPEYRYPNTEIINGELREGVTAPKYDYGTVENFFAANNIIFGSCGHDHVNDYCSQIDGRWLCYGGATGMGGYGGYQGYIRRARIFEINMLTKKVSTYKRVMGNEKEKLDLFTLY